MKIGILTFHISNNYGAMYQAYALSTILESAGHEVFFLNYHQDVPTARDYLRKPISFLGKIIGKGAFSPSFLKGKAIELRGKTIERDYVETFDHFRDHHLNIQGEAVHFADLVSDCPQADAFIVGSDQVWSADFVFSSPAYLLGFAPDSARKISYAASFGKAKLESYLRATFREHIQKFDAVSVREKSGLAIVKDVAGIEATHVLDPTLLKSDYSGIVDYSLVPDGDYMLTYRLSQSAELTNWADEVTIAIASDLGLPLLAVSTNAPPTSRAGVRHIQPTPGQLLGLIDRARFFATNSFHGTVFAINFQTPFLTLARDGEVGGQNLRMQELLNAVDASESFCDPLLPISEATGKAKLRQRFDAMHERLEPLRAVSIGFLEDALS